METAYLVFASLAAIPLLVKVVGDVLIHIEGKRTEAEERASRHAPQYPFALSTMTHDSLHKHAFWLYGVILGLAIKEALTDVVPRLFRASDQESSVFPDGMRLIIFLLLCIRFYLGSAVYFEKAHLEPVDPTKNEKKNYGLDFLFGFTHFLFFFGLALSIDVQKNPMHIFPLALSGVLLYDVLWFIASRAYVTRKLIKLWTAVNVLTFLMGAVCYLTVSRFSSNPLIAEEIAFIPVFIVSVIDIAELTTGNQIFAKWLLSIVGEKS